LEKTGKIQARSFGNRHCNPVILPRKTANRGRRSRQKLLRGLAKAQSAGPHATHSVWELRPVYFIEAAPGRSLCPWTATFSFLTARPRFEKLKEAELKHGRTDEAATNVAAHEVQKVRHGVVGSKDDNPAKPR
jgi:hypothetical protein